MNLDNILIELAKYDTPTMCNAVEAVMGTRSAVGFTKKPVVPADPLLPCIVGFAATAKIRAASPPVITPEKVQENRLSYYEYVASAKDPTIIVIEDTDYPNCIGAFWGELNVAIHKGLKIKGTLTNGLLRDIGMLDKDYQVLASGIGPSHAFVHVTQLNTSVNILGLEVRPGDLIHADLHGAMVIEKKYIEAMPEALKLVIAKEEPILKAARKNDFDIKKLKDAWKQAQKIK
jgi:regulator of RNase E activity RraA